MVDVYYDGVLCLCIPDCACCRACHKLIEDVDECPEPNGKTDLEAEEIHENHVRYVIENFDKVYKEADDGND